MAAILFSVATLALRVAAKAKVDIWRTNFVSNLVTAVSFQPFWFFAGPLPPIEIWWQPAVVATLYIVGQVLTLLSLTKGEVSIAAPVLGVKLLFVPLFIAFLGIEKLPQSIWLACVLAAVAVALLNYSSGRTSRASLVYSVGAAAAGAGAFAMFDVCVQMWSDAWGNGGFLPVMFIMSTLLSLCFIPLFEKSLFELRGSARLAVWGAGIFFALQALAIVASVAFWQKAAAANVVYSTRGLWSLLAIAIAGSALGIGDASLDRRTLRVRTIGALVMMTAIGVLLLNP